MILEILNSPGPSNKIPSFALFLGCLVGDWDDMISLYLSDSNSYLLLEKLEIVFDPLIVLEDTPLEE